MRSWFAENRLAEPLDLIKEITRSTMRGAGGVSAQRRLALDCIMVMNEQELADLRFSPSVILRAIREPKRRAD